MPAEPPHDASVEMVPDEEEPEEPDEEEPEDPDEEEPEEPDDEPEDDEEAYAVADGATPVIASTVTA